MFSKAFELFQKSAQLGNWESFVYKGKMLTQGCGTNRDIDLAFLSWNNALSLNPVRTIKKK